DSFANQEWRRMPGVDVFEISFVVEDAKKHRGVSPDLRVIAEEAVHVTENARRVGTQRHTRQGALQKIRAQRGAKTFAGNVRNQECGAAVAEGENIEIVSTYSQAREIDAAHRKVRVVAEIFRQQGLLDVASDADFLLQALPFALAFYEASVVQNARRVR